ncbi:MAG: carbohydrate binding domain-containing protein [Segetibacter sp.]
MVTGLQPNTTYVVGGYARATRDGTPVTLGVKNYGGPERRATISGTAYTQGSVTFTTGPNANQAIVYVFKPTARDVGYFDDLYLFRAPTVASIPIRRIQPVSTSSLEGR